jgi:hypothetical protein
VTSALITGISAEHQEQRQQQNRQCDQFASDQVLLGRVVLVAHRGQLAADLHGRARDGVIQRLTYLGDVVLDRRHIGGLVQRDDDQAGAAVGGAQPRIAGVISIDNIDHVRQRGHRLTRLHDRRAGGRVIDRLAVHHGDQAHARAAGVVEELRPLHRLRGTGPVGVLEMTEHGAADGDADHEQDPPPEQHQPPAPVHETPDCAQHAAHRPQNGRTVTEALREGPGIG